jgi:hypothetical protein
VNRYKRDELYSRAELKERGSSDATIDRLLPTPDDYRDNPFYTSGSPMKLYAIARVKEIENQGIDWRKSDRRAEASKRAAEKKRDELLSRLRSEEFPPLVVMAKDELESQAAKHYEQLWWERGKEKDADGSGPDFNSSMISFNLCSRLSWSLAAIGYGLGVCEYSRFSFWISAISRLSASTRSRIPPSMKRD